MLLRDLFTRGKISTGRACTFLKPSGRYNEMSHESPFWPALFFRDPKDWRLGLLL